MYGNPRGSGSDYFAIDPLMQTDVTAVQEYVGDAVYEVTFWWITGYEVVAYEICARSEEAEVADPLSCKDAISADDRIVAEVTARVMESSASLEKRETDLFMTTTGCSAGPVGFCGDTTAMAGTNASFLIEAYSKFGPSYGGLDEFEVQLVGPDAVVADVAHLRLHFYSVEYMPFVAGTYTMYISLGDAVYSKQMLTILAGAIDTERSNVTCAERVSAGDVVSVHVAASDQYGNEVQIEQGQIMLEADASHTSWPMNPMNSEAILRPTVVGNYRVYAEIRGVSPVETGDVTVSSLEDLLVVAANPVAGTIELLDFADTMVASEQHLFSLQVYDAFGNAAADEKMHVRVTISGRDNKLAVSMVTPAAGLGAYSVSTDHLQAGLYNMLASMCDVKGECSSSVRTTFQIVPDVVDMASSDFIAGGKNAVVGEALPIVLRLRDRFGNYVAERSDISIAFSTASGPTPTVSLCSTCVATDELQYLGGGEYNGVHNINVAGYYSPDLTIDGVLVHSGKEFYIGYGAQAQPELHWASAIGSNPAVVHGMKHELTTFTLQLLDAFGNKRTCDDAKISVRLVPDLDPSMYRFVSHSDGAGLYEVSLQVDKPGTYSVQVSLSTDSGRSIAALVDEVNTEQGVSFVNYGSSPAEVAMRRRAQVSINYEIEIQLSEDQIDALLSGDSANASSIMDAQMASMQALMTSDNFTSALVAEVQASGNSTFFANISADDIVAPNVTELTAAFENAVVAEPEFAGSIQVSEVAGDGSRSTTCGEDSTFQIRVYDEFNNQGESGADEIEIVAFQGTLGNNGTFASNFSGAYLVAANGARTNMIDYIYTISYTTVSCDVDAAGSSTVAFNISVNDVFQRTQTVLCVTGDIRGTTTAQEATTALSRGTNLNRLPPNVPLSGGNALTGGDRESIIVQAKDLYGNVKTEFGDLARFSVEITVPAHQERPTASDPFSAVAETTSTLQDLIANGCASCGLLEDSASGPGQYKIIYEAKYVGLYSINIAIFDGSGGSDPVTHSPFSTTVVAGQINPVFCDVTLSTSSINANEVGYATVVLFDQFKNSIPDLPVNVVGQITYNAVIEEVNDVNIADPPVGALEFGFCTVGQPFAATAACVADRGSRLVAAFTSTVARDFTVQLDYLQTPSSGTVTRLTFDSLSTHTVTVVALGFDRQQTVFLSGIERLTDCTAGEPSRMRLQLRDQFQNLNSDTIATSRWTLELQACDNVAADRTSCLALSSSSPVTGNIVSTGCSETECGPGEYEGTYTLPFTGDYQISLKLDATDINFVSEGIQSPRQILSDIPATASACTAAAQTDSTGAALPGFTALVSGETGSFAVQSQGLSGGNPEPRRGSGDNFIVTLTGADLDSAGAVQSYIGNGLYSVSYTALSSNHVTATWDFTITVQLESAMLGSTAGPSGAGQIAGSPFTATMSPTTTAAAFSFAEGAALSAGTAGQVMGFSVTGRDPFNNVITECVDASFAAVGSAFPTMPQQIVASPCVGSVYQWEYMTQRAGFYTFGVLFGGVDLGQPGLTVGFGSPFNATIISSAVSATNSYVSSSSDTSSSIATWLSGSAPTYTDLETVAGTAKTMFVHTFDVFGNRLTQAPCAGGDNDRSCFNFGFTWCQVDVTTTSLTDLAGCQISGTTAVLASSDETAAYLGVGLFEFGNRLTQSGSYRADLAVVETSGQTIAVANVPLRVAVVPAAAAATHTIASPPETVQTDTLVQFDIVARDEFDNFVHDTDLVFTLTWGTCQSSLTSACAPVSNTTVFDPSVNRYIAGFSIVTGGVAARLPLTISLGGEPVGAALPTTGGNYLIRVRAAANSPPRCYLMTDGSRDSLTDLSSDWLNPDEKRAGASLTIRVQSVQLSDTPRTVDNECSQAEIDADNTDNCDLLDEFELFAVHGTGFQPDSDAATTGIQPYSSDCTEVTGPIGSNFNPTTAAGLSRCTTEGRYKIDWSTTIAGDYTVTVKSLGITIQTDHLVDSANPPIDQTFRYPFNLTELNALGYIMPLVAVHIYPAKMDALNSLVHLQTPCDPGLIIHVPCADIGSDYLLSVVAKDTYGNRLERDGASAASQGGISEALGLAYIIKPLCAASESRCSSFQDTAFDFVYDPLRVGTYETNVSFRVGGPMEIEVKYIDVESGFSQVDGVPQGSVVSGEALTIIAKFAVALPTPDNGEAGGEVMVSTKAYGMLDYNSQSVTASHVCEWTGAAVGGTYTVPATVLGQTTNRVKILIDIEVGPENFEWRLQDTTVATSALTSAVGGPYSATNGGCADNVAGLQQFVTDEAGEHVARIVDWTTQTDCASVLDRLHHHNVGTSHGGTTTTTRGTWSCATPGRDEGSLPVKDLCPQTCGLCTDVVDALTVSLDLAGGHYTWTPTMTAGQVNGTITVTDAAGLIILPPTDFNSLSADPQVFTVHGAMEVRCDGGAPVLTDLSGDPPGRVNFRIGTRYTMTGSTPVSTLFNSHNLDANRLYTSANNEFFWFYQHPTFTTVTLDQTQEIYPGISVFSSSRPAPDFGGVRVWVPVEGGSRIVINGAGFDNGDAASKGDYQCHFNGTTDLITPARYLHNHSISCAVPALDLGVDADYEISVSKNARDFVPTGRYVRPFSATTISPTFTAAQGWGFAKVTLANAFAPADAAVAQPTAYCRFGSFSYPSDAIPTDAPRAGPGPTNAPNPRDRDRVLTNPFEGTLSTGSVFARPIRNTAGDVVDATIGLSTQSGLQEWNCPLPDIQDAGLRKPRNAYIDVAISYDGISYTNPVQIFVFDQPDFEDPAPPIGPTGGGTPIEIWSKLTEIVAGAGVRNYLPIRDMIVPWCKFKTGSGRSASLALGGACCDEPPCAADELVLGQCPLAGPNLAIKRAEEVLIQGDNIGFKCVTPPNPDPGASYYIEISLDDKKTWSFESDDSERVRNYIRFVYYAETVIITTTETYSAAQTFRSRIDSVAMPSDPMATLEVRFQYSCGYTRDFPELIRCRYGCDPVIDPADGSSTNGCPLTVLPAVAVAPMLSNATLEDIGATVVNRVACQIPVFGDTATLKIALSLNGVDYTPLTQQTNFVYFGAAISLFGGWQSDASSQATLIGQSWTQAAERLVSLPVVYVEIRDNKGSFVSEDQYATYGVQLTFKTQPDPNADVWHTVWTGAGTESDKRFLGLQVPKVLGSPIENAGIDTPPVAVAGNCMQNSGFLISNCVPGTAGSTMFVGLALNHPPSSWNYRAEVTMGISTSSGYVDTLAPYILELVIITGATSIQDTQVMVQAEPVPLPRLDVRPGLKFILQVQAKDSAGNSIVSGGDKFRTRVYLTEGSLACGSYVTPTLPATTTEGLSPTDAQASARAQCPGACRSEDSLCLGGETGQNIAEKVLEFTMTNATTGVTEPRLLCTDVYEGPLCTAYNPGRSQNVAITKSFTRTSDGTDEVIPPRVVNYDGVGGFSRPDVIEFDDVTSPSPGQYLLETGFDMSLEANRVPAFFADETGAAAPLRLWGDFNVFIEGKVTAAGALIQLCPDGTAGGCVVADEARSLGWKTGNEGSYWVPVSDVDNGIAPGSPFIGTITPVDCSGDTNPAVVTDVGGELFYEGWDPTQPGEDGALPDDIGSQCTCKAGYQTTPVPRPGMLEGQVDCETCPIGTYKTVDDTIAQVATGNPCVQCEATTSTRAEGSASHLDCLCADNYYDFRNTMLTCIPEDWYRAEAAEYLNPTTQGYAPARLKDAVDTDVRCLSAPNCVKTFVNGTIWITSEHWTFADGNDELKGKNKPSTYFDLFKNTERRPGLCTRAGVEQDCLPGVKVDQPQLGAQAFQPAGERPGGLPSQLVLQVYKCKHSPKGGNDGRTCAGGPYQLYQTVDGGCLKGAEGVTCAACKKPNALAVDVDDKEGYRKGDVDCEPCLEREDGQGIGLKILVFLVGFVATVGVVAGAFILLKRAKMEDVLKLKILIAFGQVVQSFADTYSISWPDGLKAFFGSFAVLNLDIFRLGSIECSPTMNWVKSYYYRFSVIVLVMPAFAGLFVIAYIVEVQLDKRKLMEKELQTGEKMSVLEAKINSIEIKGRYMQRFFLVMVMLYLKVSKTTLMMFAHRQFEPAPGYEWDNDEDTAEDEKRGYIEADMKLSTDVTIYYLMWFLALICTFVYPLGVPAIFLGLMWRERDQIHDAINQKKFGFLFADYVSIYFLWECWDLMRKLALSGMLIFFRRGSVMQLVAAMLIALVALEAHIRVMPYADFLANIAQWVAFNAIFLNLIGAMLLKVKFEPGVDDGLGQSFADGMLMFVNICVPIIVLGFVAASVGYDMYLLSIGRVMKGGLAGQSRKLLLQAIGARKENRVSNVKRRKNVAEKGMMLLYYTLWKREDVDDALLAEELAYVEKRRDERDKSIILFRQAQVHLEEKREWYRFVYNHSDTEEEFNEIVQTESLSSYKRLMLGLEEDEEDDIHERVTREITQAGNQADDVVEEGFDDEADMENPMFDLDEEEEKPKKSKKEKKEKKKKAVEEDDADWDFGEKSVDKGNTEFPDDSDFDAPAAGGRKKKEKKEKKPKKGKKAAEPDGAEMEMVISEDEQAPAKGKKGKKAVEPDGAEMEMVISEDEQAPAKGKKGKKAAEPDGAEMVISEDDVEAVAEAGTANKKKGKKKK